MENFTPWSALIGGALIGMATALLLWLNGRIAGISGIFHGLLNPRAGDVAWRAWFIVGLIGGAAAYVWLNPSTYTPRIGFSVVPLALGGFFVGFGTRMSGGCTSGHGICGVARLSPRSITATIVFVSTGMATVFAVRHLLGAQP